MIHTHEDETLKQDPANRIAWLPLLCAVTIMLVLSIYPNILVKQDGAVDKIATYMLLWSMTSGFIRGVGFIPRARIFAALFSSTAFFMALSFSLIHLRFF